MAEASMLGSRLRLVSSGDAQQYLPWGSTAWVTTLRLHSVGTNWKATRVGARTTTCALDCHGVLPRGSPSAPRLQVALRW